MPIKVSPSSIVSQPIHEIVLMIVFFFFFFFFFFFLRIYCFGGRQFHWRSVFQSHVRFEFSIASFLSIICPSTYIFLFFYFVSILLFTVWLFALIFVFSSLRCDHVPSYRIPSKKKQKDKKRAVTDDSTSSESETDSELELYRGATDGLNPLQRRMIRAKVKRDLARQAGADLPPSDDEQQRDAKDAGKKRFTHSFYAVEETSEERKKRRKHEKHEAKRARKQERRAAKAAERNASAAETVSSTTPAATTAAPQGGMSNPFLAAKLREMAQRERD
jgi:hypothetical protein